MRPAKQQYYSRAVGMPAPAHALFPARPLFCNSYIGARLVSAFSQPGFSGRGPDRTIGQLTAAHAPASKPRSRSARIDPRSPAP
ncbi:hypothetical protein M441DRAFT_339945 [Trichoderma asperellum CBS 433.97]|uniref:Uncharacterized protein n=1 Tax=Trichoderma asperellum (strain ATCC 204424 / CBS 433.97 / NBRC 101777) TaxID=1042311 RepID=A0A2T3ZGV0_TRIA4|nr:hypothetical protein M441DRAFT_339945 [Trichoderma asperellum CBS 433.97]PTB44019.1 hypothetical protein M441DRAFT_339945 [Trichoderma asperellum CBS 433.97]